MHTASPSKALPSDRPLTSYASLAHCLPRLSLPPWIPHHPHRPQLAALLAPQGEILYGGAAGGGKTDALLMAALQYSDRPNFNGVIFRRTYPQLNQADGLIDRSRQWMEGKGPIYNASERCWKFPAGGKLYFRHMENKAERYAHQGAAYHFIGWDELTHWPDDEAYRYLMSRLRRAQGDTIPLRCVATSNPGGAGHAWVKARFIDAPDAVAQGRLFIPARLEDNPSLDRAAYEQQLLLLPEVERRRLREGDWSVSSGALFPRRFLRVVAPQDVPQGLRWIRSWDTATSAKTRADQSAAIKMSFDSKGGILYLSAPRAGRWEGPDVLEEIVTTALEDGPQVEICVEGVASQVMVIQHLQRDPRLLQHRIRRTAPTTDKLAAALPWSQRWKGGQVVLVDGYDWSPWVDQWSDFDGDPSKKDDKVDCVSRGMEVLSKGGDVESSFAMPPAPKPTKNRFF